MGKHTLPGQRRRPDGRSRVRGRHAAPSTGAGRRLAAPAALTAVLLASGATTGTAFAGEGGDSGSASTSESGGSGSDGGSESDGSGSDGGSESDGSGSDGTSESGGSGADDCATDTPDGDSGDADCADDTGSSSDSERSEASVEGSEDAGSGDAPTGDEGSASGDTRSEASSGSSDQDTGSSGGGPLGALGGLTSGIGKAPDLTSATSGLKAVPDPTSLTTGLGSAVPGGDAAHSAVNGVGDLTGTAIGTDDEGTGPGAGSPVDPEAVAGLAQLPGAGGAALPGLGGGGVPDAPAVPGLSGTGTGQGLPDVPLLTTGNGPLKGLADSTSLPDVSGVTGKDGLAPDLSPLARAAGLPDYSGLGGLPDIAGVAGGPSNGPTTVDLKSKSPDGINGTTTIDENRVTGTATGLDPDAEYVSFFYGATSSATNQNPCILDGTNPLPAGQTVGTWDVDENGNGTLSADNPLGNMYKLQAGTMSIRKVEHGFDKSTALPVNPASYSLASCGEVNRISTADPATNAVPKLPTGNLPKVPYVSGPGLQN